MPSEIRYDIGEIKAAQDSPDGYRHVYVRLAKADHPYRYFNQDGTKRIEMIQTADLFDPLSTGTAKNLPILNGHPAFKLDSSNIGGHIHGVLGERFMKEDTTNGTFLGAIAVLHTDEAKALADKRPGVSPGYRTDIERRDGNSYWQKNRQYNHLANGVIPRGGNDVRGMFEGVRIDSAGEDSPIWIAQRDDCYECEIDKEFVTRAFEYRGDELFLSKKPIDLTNVLKPRHDKKSCGCDECAAKSDDGPGDKPKATTKTRKKKRRKPMGTPRIDGIDWEGIPAETAATIGSAFQRLDALESVSAELDEVKTQLLEAQGDRADAEAKLETLEEEFKAFETEVQERQDAIDEANANAEGENDDTIRFDEDEYMEHVVAGIATAMQMRDDADLLYDMGILKDRVDSSPEFLVENMAELQKEMVAIAAPSLKDRLDEYDDTQVAQAYEIAFSSLRDSANRRSDGKSKMPGLLQVGQRMARNDGSDRQDTRRGMSNARKAELKAQHDAFEEFSQRASQVNAMANGALGGNY